MGRKLRGDYNVLPKWFSGNPLPPAMEKRYKIRRFKC